MNNIKTAREWIDQSSYDYETAKDLFKTGRYIYTVFMCHLAIEKFLKSIFVIKFKKNPFKTHDLNYLCEIIKLDLSEDIQVFIEALNELSVPTRYPDQLKVILKQYGKQRAKSILDKTNEVLIWLKKNKK
ncbi:MAG: HEPN domain-containing protein [Candidatus Omnitrophota bacterium]|nr:HEPN domain-containing protein [Candidatus Omnitrophota bacterium]